MTTSPTTMLTSEIFDDGQLSVGALSYFRARLKSRIHQVVLSLFLERNKEDMNCAALSRRLQKAPEQITRWLSSPGNMRLDTVSDLLLAMGYELHVEARRINSVPRANDVFNVDGATLSQATQRSKVTP